MKSRNHSILTSNLKKCYVCGTSQNIHIHEVFYGTANRKNSIEWGCYCGLCGYHHNLSNDGVHFNKELDNKLKKACQEKFEELYGHDQFMKVFHKNYIE